MAGFKGFNRHTDNTGKGYTTSELSKSAGLKIIQKKECKPLVVT
jgi:hypothetical protein